MKVYQQISGYSKSILNVTFNIEDSESYFSFAGGLGVTGVGSTGLDATGFIFSGIDGYLFDQSGNFFGGYQPKVPFDIDIHIKTGNNLSYYHNGKLIANNLNAPYLDYLELDRISGAAYVTVKGMESDIVTGDILFFSGAGLMFSGEYIFY